MNMSMSNAKIKQRFEKIDDSFEADKLRVVEFVITESKKNGMSIEEIREKYVSYIPSLDNLYKKAILELKWLSKNYFDTPHYNMDTGKIYNIKERINRVKKILLGETANK